eukprot:TRINITY_DN12742_c0_g3_i1.p1 TRINITY_DN12742_c0_g3~~TRINITY_DN12742_c0_g3_i1.p1  ORF type:complete len:128 (+),score=2.81 TRINITY_DN12742_c0_g3_i1:161-544(+)
MQLSGANGESLGSRLLCLTAGRNNTKRSAGFNAFGYNSGPCNGEERRLPMAISETSPFCVATIPACHQAPAHVARSGLRRAEAAGRRCVREVWKQSELVQEQVDSGGRPDLAVTRHAFVLTLQERLC